MPSELKFAVLMKCVTGNLKTFLQVTLSESTTYDQLREEILRYDNATIRWNSNMALGTALPGQEDAGGPMDVDRISKGKYGDKGKGKGKQYNHDNYGKGKAGDGKGKSSWSNSAWNQQSKSYNNKGWSKGKQQSKGDEKGAKSFSKGKGKPTCHNCRATRHFARDCQVRAVADQLQDGTQASVSQTSPSTVSSSTGSTTRQLQPVSKVNRISAEQHVHVRMT